MPLGCHWDVIGNAVGVQRRGFLSIHINLDMSVNIIITNIGPTIDIYINRMPLGATGCHWDATGNWLGCHWDATGMQRRVLSNIRINLSMNMTININTNTNPTISIHIRRMP